MSSMTFQINDASTSGGYPAVWVTINENSDGTLTFTVTQADGIVGDLRGLFFDVKDEGILSTLNIINADGTMTELRIGNDSVKDLGDGANMNGLLGSDGGYDVGIEIGTSGIAKDDIRSFSFTLDSSARDLTLADFGGVDFAARLTSVGMVGGKRADSSKILEITSQAVDAQLDVALVDENQKTIGNVLSNDATGGTSTVTSWTAENGTQLTVGGQYELHSDGDTIGTVKLNADGSYTVDASAADELSQGETIVYTFNYGVRNQTELTSWSDDTATFEVVVTGKNDGPDARNDEAETIENATVTTGSVLANDSDIDRLDTISVTGWSGGALDTAAVIQNGAGATFELKSDGSYVLDASAADALSAGETITQSFTYTLSDNHDATDTATITVTVTGENDGPDAQNDAVGSVAEDQILTGAVTGNDSDIDRLDTHTFALASEWTGPGTLSFDADGTWSYDSGDLASLNDGEVLNLSFNYVMTDNHGASDTATVSFSVNGAGGSTTTTTTTTGGTTTTTGNETINTVDNSYPTFQKDISHAVLVFDTKSGDRNGDGYYTVKIDEYGGESFSTMQKTDLDASIDSILAWLVANDANIDANTVFLGAQIKGGDVGSALNSYDDYWANDGDSTYTVVSIDKDSGHGTTTELVSADQAPVNMSQIYQNQVDTTYEYDNVMG